ncbi:hypothetical protein IAT38_000645 [Cryptococcus sp. DSM 104549]
MSVLIKLLGAITPPPAAPVSREYDGYELRWKMFTFRPAEFKFEAVAFTVLGSYLLLYFIGRFINNRRAKEAMAPFKPYLSTQFTSTRGLIASSPSLHLLFATGRRSVLALHATLELTPFQDLPSLVYHFARSLIEPTFDGSEKIVWDLTLGMGADGLQGEGVGVWSVVEKGVMRDLKSKRWDMTFPKLQETSLLPVTHALFTEHSEVTDVLLKTPNVGILDVLADPTAASLLKYLLVTDVPATRPTNGPLSTKSRSRHIILAVGKPSSQAEVEAVVAWLQVALNIADLISKPVLKPEVSRKLLKTRQGVDADLAAAYKKEKEEENPPEETAEEKRAAKKRAERALMSDKELKRAEELDRKREMRKMQKKQMAK